MAPGFAVHRRLDYLGGDPVQGIWQDGQWRQLVALCRQLSVGILYLLAVTSIGVYGIAIAGWAWTTKYSMLGGFAPSAQVISYELALGLSISGVVMQKWDVARAKALSDVHGQYVEHGATVYGLYHLFDCQHRRSGTFAF
jgi:NADH-quinone oxidoreductase subunit H